MYCESCGSFIPDGQAFCSNCGAKAPVIMNAGTPVQPVQPVQPTQFAELVEPVYEPVMPTAPVKPVYHQGEFNPAFGQNVLVQVPSSSVSNRSAKAGLIFGIVSMVGVYLPYFNIIPAIPGLIFSLVGLKKSGESGGKGKSITGLCLSCTSILLWIAMIIGGIVRVMNGENFF